jgi:hypothetical protein
MKTSPLILLLFFLAISLSRAQSVIINMAPVDGIDITADNALSFQVQSTFNGSTNALVKGLIRFRNSDMRISYEFRTILQPGINSFSADVVHPTWNFSSSALRELFKDYKILPQGTYEYCVTVYPDYHSGEGVQGSEETECLYRQSEDLFSINLLEPEIDAKLYEYNPMLTWVANYPFAGALTYRVRVAEIKKGQNPANAINRNNPVYEEKNVMQSSILYPVYAKPLQTWQPYAWTVDAYYKGILLGGAEIWKFTIIEDSLLIAVSRDPSFIELNIEHGDRILYAVGELKLKYLERERKSNELRFRLTDEKGKEIRMKDTSWNVSRGDNRRILQFSDVLTLKHKKNYRLQVTTADNQVYKVSFTYINPLYLKPQN